MASNIQKYSLNYWSENLSHWKQAFIDKGLVEPTSSKSVGRALAEIGAMDVAGGVIAAGATWAVNVFAPPPIGQLGYTGAIIGGAITTSGLTAAGHIMDAIFDMW